MPDHEKHDYETILVEADRGVVTITLNRPEQRNAINLKMQQELLGAIRAAEADDGARAIVLTGAGKAFCSGVDLTEGGFGDEYREAHDAELGVTEDTIWEHVAYWRMTTPIIGAINGAAIGAGLTLPLTCDLCYVADDARLQFAFTRLGVAPDAGSTWLVSRLVGAARAAELLLSGRPFTGAEAAAMGLCARAVPAGEVLVAAQELAHDIADNTAPLAVAVTKRLLNDFLHAEERGPAITRETKLIWWLGRQPDAVEGVMAKIEKRAPDWKGSKHTPYPEGLD